MFAEKIFINGNVYTMEHEAEAVEAFAVRDHKIVATGTTEEISRMLHIKPSTVRMQLSRGRAYLKEKLKGEWEDENPLPNDV